MIEYVAFLRAVNVGGRSVVRMADVCDAFGAAGCRHVRSFIASGNILFESGSANEGFLIKRIRRAVTERLQVDPAVLLRRLQDLETLVAKDPFKNLRKDRTAKLYVAFLSRKPPARITLPLTHEKDALDVIAASGREAFIVSRPRPNGFYGFPNNFLEQQLGVTGTTRNWSTVRRVVQFARLGGVRIK